MTTHSKSFAILGLGLTILAIFLFKHSYFIHDDTFITLRYAVNFAQTGLPQWNPGEWVEGYTSLLHVTLLAGLISIGIDPVLAVHLTNGAAVLALLLFTLKATNLIAPAAQTYTRVLTLITVAASPPLALWLLGGLETPIVAAFIFAGLTWLIAHLHTPNLYLILLTILAFSCAILTRLDSAVFVAGSGLGYLLASPAPFRKRLTIACLVVGLPAAVAFTQMAIRHSVYGELFPLTFYAKTDLSLLFRLQNGSLYLGKSLIFLPLLAVAGAALLIARTKGFKQPTITLLTTPILLHLAYAIWAGGDHMPAARMLFPLLAPMALLTFAIAQCLPKPSGRALLLAAAATSLISAVQRPPQKMDDAAFVGKLVGQHIETTWPQNITIALNTAGTTPYFARTNRTYVDMLGLNDPTIAKRNDTPMLTEVQNWPGHTKGDGAYVLSRKPDRIIAGPAEGRDIALSWFLSGAEMNQIPEFHTCYTKQVEEIPYSQAFAAKGPSRPNPLQFTYYLRTCD